MPLPFLADENFDGDLLRALLRRAPALDLVRVQDVGLSGADDADVLAWAATEGRIMLTHDLRTMVGFAYERVRNDQAMPGVIGVPMAIPIRVAVDDLVFFEGCAWSDDFDHRVVFLPFQ